MIRFGSKMTTQCEIPIPGYALMVIIYCIIFHVCRLRTHLAFSSRGKNHSRTWRAQVTEIKLNGSIDRKRVREEKNVPLNSQWCIWRRNCERAEFCVVHVFDPSTNIHPMSRTIAHITIAICVCVCSVGIFTSSSCYFFIVICLSFATKKDRRRIVRYTNSTHIADLCSVQRLESSSFSHLGGNFLINFFSIHFYTCIARSSSNQIICSLNTYIKRRTHMLTWLADCTLVYWSQPVPSLSLSLSSPTTTTSTEKKMTKMKLSSTQSCWERATLSLWHADNGQMEPAKMPRVVRCGQEWEKERKRKNKCTHTY